MKASDLLFLFLFIILLDSCSEKSKQKIIRGNKFDDQAMKEIYQLQDRRRTDSLLTYFDLQEADYRREAALALASVQDTLATRKLINLLHDEFVDVRLAASYALGQLKSPAAEEGLLNALDDEHVPLVRRELWESLGRCGKETGLNKLVSFQAEDSLDKEGISWGLYRIGLKGMANPQTTRREADYLSQPNPYESRLGAANYFARARNIDIREVENTIATSAQIDPSPFVRMASARALSRASDTIRRETLHTIITDEPDPRVIINAINSLSGDERDKAIVANSLHHPNVNVCIVAAGFIASHQELFRNEIAELSDKVNNWRAHATILGVGIGLPETRELFSQKAKAAFLNSKNVYERAALLQAMGNAVQNHEFIWEQLQNAEAKVLTTSAISALANIRSLENFDPSLQDTFLNYFKSAILSGDLAMIGIASGVLSNSNFDYKSKISDYSFLNQAKGMLSLPKDNEALQVLERTIDYFEGRVTAPVKNEYNHPIDWETVSYIPQGQKAIIYTTKGNIVIELLVNESPGSTENFYTLAKAHYYDGKVFHRVVPNFVIQGGCPRGDGWGGEDYSIRSELGPLRYKEGSVGMASAGKDTEGVQWFITHSPTPHLDGAYSIFGQVVEGMNVVNAIEVGDVIEKIEFPESR